MKEGAFRAILLAAAVVLVGGCGGNGEPAVSAASTTAAMPDTTEAPTSSASFAVTTHQIDADLSMREVADGVYVIRHDLPWPANSLLVEMADGDLVLVDTPYTPAATEQVLTWAESGWGPGR